MIREKAVSVILFYIEKESPKYLLLKYGRYSQTHWDFIKGKIQVKEGIRDTAKREALEETGIKGIKILPEFKEKSGYQYKKDGGDIVDKKVIYLVAEISKEKAKKIALSEEHQDFKWVSYKEAKDFIAFENQKEILKKADYFVQKIKRINF